MFDMTSIAVSIPAYPAHPPRRDDKIQRALTDDLFAVIALIILPGSMYLVALSFEYVKLKCLT